MLELQSFLRRIAPFVVVVGSFGRMEETEASDIDCFLRSRPRAEVEIEADNETYMQEILATIDGHGLVVDSIIFGHIAVERQHGFPRMVEVSSHYIIPTSAKLFYRDVCGVRMLCASADGKEYAKGDVYDHIDWDEQLCDAVIRHPLPAFDAKEDQE